MKKRRVLTQNEAAQLKKEKLHNIVIAALVLMMLISAGNILIPKFSEINEDEHRGKTISLNEGWTKAGADDAKQYDLPFSETVESGSGTLVIENRMTSEFAGRSLVIAVQNAAVRVYLGNESGYIKYYEKGFIKAAPDDAEDIISVGSRENVIDMPAELPAEGIRIELVPVRKNSPVVVESVSSTQYDTLVIGLIEKGMAVFTCCIVIIICCIMMFIVDCIRVFSGWGRWELPYLILFGIICISYMITKMRILEVLLGNAQFFEFFSAFSLTIMPAVLIAHLSKRFIGRPRLIFRLLNCVFLFASFVASLLFAYETETRSLITFIARNIIIMLLFCAAILITAGGIRQRKIMRFVEAAGYLILMVGFILNGTGMHERRNLQVHDNSAMLCIAAFYVIVLVSNIITVVSEYKKKTEKAEKEAIAASEAKSSFLSSMSHEIRTPINAMLGMNEMILRECSDEKIIDYSESIKNAGNTLLGLVNDILDFSKIEAGKIDIIPVNYDLSSVLNDLVNMIHLKAEAKGLELKMNIDPSIPKQLNGDDIRLKQVITNILTNAVKYTEKGSVTLDMGYSKVQDDEDCVMLNVRVSDTGIGIKEEDMAKLFGEFERIEELRNRSVEGTGLGMSITRRLLSLMDSSLSVESEYGKGSVFSFSIKQKVVGWEALGDYEEAFRRSITERKRYKERFTAPDAQILVVDDNPMNLSVFKNLLKQTKVRVDQAESGDEGIALAASKQYDIMFIDHMMPDKDGIETLAQIRNDQGPNSKTTAVCLTANAVSGARELYLKAGFDDYLTKPIDPSRLERMIMNYLPDDKVIINENREAEDEHVLSEEEMAKQLPQWLKNIAQIDVLAGIRHCKGVEPYLDAVRIYESLVDTNAGEIEHFIEEKDVENATINIHALKSTSRVIGAEDLGAFAERLENAGKAHDTETLYSQAGELVSCYRALGADLKPIVSDGTEKTEELIPADEDMLGEMYTAIEEFMSVSDYDSAVEIIEGLKKYSVPDDQKERCRSLIAAASEIRYEDIEQILKTR